MNLVLAKKFPVINLWSLLLELLVRVNTFAWQGLKMVSTVLKVSFNKKTHRVLNHHKHKVYDNSIFVEQFLTKLMLITLTYLNKAGKVSQSFKLNGSNKTHIINKEIPVSVY